MSYTIRSTVRLLGTGVLAVAATLAACSDAGGATEPTGPQSVALRFAAEVNGQPFSCARSYPAVGTTNSTIQPLDFRFYVHNVRLVTRNGQEVPLTMPDNIWQRGGVALLDFENQTGTCTGGTADTNAVVSGTVPAGDYTRVRFTLGLPFALNHQDAATAPAPFNYTSLWWSWAGGYKFARLDFASTGQPQGWFIHLGSTGCNAAAGNQAPTTCTEPNRVEVALDNFDVARNVVVADVGRVVAQNNVDVNAGGARGCMSGLTDPECPAVLSAFGIAAGSAQRFFSMR
jgi:uncharacterized repeat protein (TIGR04052 family)